MTKKIEDYMLPIQTIFLSEKQPVCICFAVNETYSQPLQITLYSLIKYTEPSRCYDILILTKNLEKESRQKIANLAQDKTNVSIRFIDMKKYEQLMEGIFPKQSYLTIETNYRLFLVTRLFQNYSKMIYLDCDTLLFTDVAKLYDINLEGKLAGAVEEYSFRYYLYLQNPVFVQRKPYSIRSYCTKIIGLSSMEDYFNAGVLVLDLEKLREITNLEEMLKLLFNQHYLMNDQDVLNYVVKGNYVHINVEWNYLNCYDYFRHDLNVELQQKFLDVYCDEPLLIHYVGPKKPWKDMEVPLQMKYTNVMREMNKIYI